MNKDNRYMLRGVSAAKEDVHNAIKNIDKGIFPQAFCKIIPDILGGDPEYCNIMHADGETLSGDQGLPFQGLQSLTAQTRHGSSP